MAKISAKDCSILINGYNFSTFATSFEAKSDAGKIDVTGFTEGCVNYIPGMPQTEMTADMFWDGAANSVHAALGSLPTGVITILGGTLGGVSISMPFMQATYTPKGAPKEALTIGSIEFANFGSNLGMEHGWSLAHGTIATTTTGTGYVDPGGIAVTAQCVGTLHVWSPCTGSYVIKIQHSTAAGSGYADLITFVANGATRTVERQVLASGTVNPYRRVVATGSSSLGFSVHFFHNDRGV